MPLMRQPSKAAVSKRQPGEVALRQREVFKQDEFNVGFLFGGLRKQRARDRRKGEVLQLWRVVFHINTEYSTCNARTTNKKTTPEECMLKNPTQVNHCVHLSDSML